MSPRSAITLIFLLNGFGFGNWGARVPALQDHLGYGPAALSFPLAAIAAGALLTMGPAGRLASRRGSHWVVRRAVLVLGVGFALPQLVPGLVLVTLVAFLLGATNGALDVSMNAQGVAIERRLARPILSSLHAGFSGGALAGAGTGALAAWAGLAGDLNLVATGAVVLVGGLIAGRALIEDRDVVAPEAEDAPTAAGRWHLRALAFCGLFAEGAVTDWSAVHLRSIGATAALAAVAFALFQLTMTSGRLAGDGLTARLGPVALVRWGGTAGAMALALGLVAGVPAIALAGYLMLGLGLAVIVPLVFRAAATGADAGPALAAVTTTGYLGFLAGPPLIGAIAGLTSVPAALSLVVLATLFVGVGAGAVAPRPGVVAEVPGVS